MLGSGSGRQGLRDMSHTLMDSWAVARGRWHLACGSSQRWGHGVWVRVTGYKFGFLKFVPENPMKNRVFNNTCSGSGNIGSSVGLRIFLPSPSSNSPRFSVHAIFGRLLVSYNCRSVRSRRGRRRRFCSSREGRRCGLLDL